LAFGGIEAVPATSATVAGKAFRSVLDDVASLKKPAMI
jgi:hypothetical protein